jgi:acetoin utilization deacetylase AcuC-like enzyme
MNRTGIVRDNLFMEHVMDPGHPERPERLKVIYEELDEVRQDLPWVEVQSRPATRQELETTHSPGYLDLLASTAGKSRTHLDADTSTSARSYEAALFAAGGFCELIKEVCEGRLTNGFALVRPPGHHAEQDRAMGFCLLNNVAVGARFALKHFAYERILIVDWDVHHGNGTQHSFYTDPRVLYVSTHRSGFFYPGTGRATDVGKGTGEGFNVNIPFSGGEGDREFEMVFEKILTPIALEYRPQLVLVSAGFDIHYDDPLGGMEVTEEGFARMTRILMRISDETAQGKLVITLEGGYDIEGEKRSVKAVLKELLQGSPAFTKDRPAENTVEDSRIEHLIRQIKEIQKRYWKTL